MTYIRFVGLLICVSFDNSFNLSVSNYFHLWSRENNGSDLTDTAHSKYSLVLLLAFDASSSTGKSSKGKYSG